MTAAALINKLILKLSTNSKQWTTENEDELDGLREFVYENEILDDWILETIDLLEDRIEAVSGYYYTVCLVEKVAMKMMAEDGYVVKESVDILHSDNPKIRYYVSLAEIAVDEII